MFFSIYQDENVYAPTPNTFDYILHPLIVASERIFIIHIMAHAGENKKYFLSLHLYMLYGSYIQLIRICQNFLLQ